MIGPFTADHIPAGGAGEGGPQWRLGRLWEDQVSAFLGKEQTYT